MLEEIKETQRVQGNMLQSVVRKLSASNEHPVLPEGIHFPLKSIAEFEDMEKRAEDVPFSNACVSFATEIY